MKRFHLSRLLPLALLGLGLMVHAAEPVTPAEVNAVTGANLTPDQRESLRAIDVRLEGVEALAAKVQEPYFKYQVTEAIADLKKKRLEQEKNFDQGLYESLMHSVISQYQKIALWLKPPALPPPPGFKPAKAPEVKKDQKGSGSNAPGTY